MAEPYQPATGVYQVEMRYVWNGQQAEMCWHVFNAAEASLTDVGDWFATVAHAQLRPAQSNTCLLQDVKVIDLSTQDGAVAIVLVGTAGTVNTSSVNNQLAPCISLTTAKRGRSYSGRKYLPGLAAGFLDVNNITGDAVTIINTAFTAIRTGALGSGWPIGVLSRVINKVRRPEAVFTPIVTAALKDSLIDTQRRRKPGVGV